MRKKVKKGVLLIFISLGISFIWMILVYSNKELLNKTLFESPLNIVMFGAMLLFFIFGYGTVLADRATRESIDNVYEKDAWKRM